MRSNLLLFALAAALSGCATFPAVVPAGGAPQATASAANVNLTVFPSAWDGEPDDLPDYLTPVAVELYNAGAEPVRVSFYDFALTDVKGVRLAALNPFVPMSARAEPTPDAEREPIGGVLVAWRGGGGRMGMPAARPGPQFGGSRSYGGGRYVGPRSVGPRYGGPGYVGPRYGGAARVWGPRANVWGYGPRPFVRPGGVYLGAPRWRGYSVLPYYRPWFGFGFSYWADPFLWPPGYATWVWGWSPAYYPSPMPPEDMVEYGLPEGVLEPGGRASGFLYFQRAPADAQHLQLSWTVTAARTGQALGEARVALDVRR